MDLALCEEVFPFVHPEYIKHGLEFSFDGLQVVFGFANGRVTHKTQYKE